MAEINRYVTRGIPPENVKIIGAGNVGVIKVFWGFSKVFWGRILGAATKTPKYFGG